MSENMTDVGQLAADILNALGYDDSKMVLGLSLSIGPAGATATIEQVISQEAADKITTKLKSWELSKRVVRVGQPEMIDMPDDMEMVALCDDGRMRTIAELSEMTQLHTAKALVKRHIEKKVNDDPS